MQEKSLNALTFHAAIQFSTHYRFKVRANNELVNNYGQNVAILLEFFDLSGGRCGGEEEYEFIQTVSLAGLQNPTFEQAFKLLCGLLKNLNTKTDPQIFTDYTDSISWFRSTV